MCLQYGKMLKVSYFHILNIEKFGYYFSGWLPLDKHTIFLIKNIGLLQSKSKHCETNSKCTLIHQGFSIATKNVVAIVRKQNKQTPLLNRYIVKLSVKSPSVSPYLLCFRPLSPLLVYNKEFKPKLAWHPKQKHVFINETHNPSSLGVVRSVRGTSVFGLCVWTMTSVGADMVVHNKLWEICDPILAWTTFNIKNIIFFIKLYKNCLWNVSISSTHFETFTPIFVGRCQFYCIGCGHNFMCYISLLSNKYETMVLNFFEHIIYISLQRISHWV
jgi:hypothetical protein